MANVFIDVSTPAPAILIQDEFTGSAGTINGRTPDTVDVPGSQWSVVNSSLSVDGAGSLTLPSGDAAALIELGLANGFYVEVVAQLSSGGYLGIDVNSASYNNGWEFGVYGGGSVLEVYYNIGGGYALEDSVAVSIGVNTPFTVRIEVTVAGFEYFVGGVSVGSHLRGSDNLFDAETMIGLISSIDVGSMTSYKAGAL